MFVFVRNTTQILCVQYITKKNAPAQQARFFKLLNNTLCERFTQNDMTLCNFMFDKLSAFNLLLCRQVSKNRANTYF